MQDAASLNLALQGFPLCGLGPACRDRVDALRTITEGGEAQRRRPEPEADAAEPVRVQTDQATFLVLTYACCVNHAQWFVQNEVRHLMCKVAALTPMEKGALLGRWQVVVQPMETALADLRVLSTKTASLRRQERTLCPVPHGPRLSAPVDPANRPDTQCVTTSVAAAPDFLARRSRQRRRAAPRGCLRAGSCRCTWRSGCAASHAASV